MCKIFNVSKSCYYRWLSIDNQDDYQLNELVKNVFITSRKTYGTRRIKKRLEQLYGLIISRRKIGKIMYKLGLKCLNKRRFRVQTTNSNHNYMISPNYLNQDFYASYPDEKYVGDITYIPTKEGWLYLATVIDLYSRKVVGWSMDDSMKTSLVNDALFMALKQRQPDKGLIWHTDRGTQYASDSHRELLHEFGIIQSMSAKGNCYDNAVSESFFHTLKTELIHHVQFDTRSQAHQMIFEYIEIFYNRQRLHSSNNYMSPVDYEEKMLQKEIVA
jgi:transposase InsO family protein